MTYFTKDITKFLKQLENNNNRDWFNENKQRYIDSVKNPFEIFIGDLIEAMSTHYDSLPTSPKEAIFRIYRDVRFGKNKDPYKTNVSAIVSPGGRKDKTMPGLYVEISSKELKIFSGLYQLETKQLQNVRSHISHNLEAFDKLIGSKKFVSTFGEIRGEKNKRIGKEFEEDAKIQPLLFNKQFYFYTTLPVEAIYDDKLIEKIVATYLIAKPVSEFLYEGIF